MGTRSKKKKPKSTKAAKSGAPSAPPLELVKGEEEEAAPSPRPLNSIQALQYTLGLTRDNLLAEKKRNIEQEEDIAKLKRELADLKRKLLTKEESESQRLNRELLQQLGIGANEEVVVENGRLFVAPSGTAKRHGG